MEVVMTKISLSDIKTTPQPLPIHMLIHAPAGWMKTSIGAYAPAPIFMLSKGELGLITLKNNGRVPQDVPHFPELTTWDMVNEALDVLLNETHPYKTLVLDTMNGMETLCHEALCASADYNNSWAKFNSFNSGQRTSEPKWRDFLDKLDLLRTRKGMAIISLCHTVIRSVNNPQGESYSRYEPAISKENWAQTNRRVDMTLFGHFVIDTQKDSANILAKAKGFGGKQRLVYSEPDATYEAKTRNGMPDKMILPNTPDQAWAKIMGYLTQKAEAK
jgi:hypothetical protein